MDSGGIIISALLSLLVFYFGYKFNRSNTLDQYKELINNEIKNNSDKYNNFKNDDKIGRLLIDTYNKYYNRADVRILLNAMDEVAEELYNSNIDCIYFKIETQKIRLANRMITNEEYLTNVNILKINIMKE